jgi:hypothetical protein
MVDHTAIQVRGYTAAVKYLRHTVKGTCRTIKLPFVFRNTRYVHHIRALPAVETGRENPRQVTSVARQATPLHTSLR